MKRPTAYCDTCESTVYADDVHSCFDAKALRAQQERERALTDAERRVVEAAKRWWELRRPSGWSAAQHAGNATVNCTSDTEEHLAIAVATALDATPTRDTNAQ